MYYYQSDPDAIMPHQIMEQGAEWFGTLATESGDEFIIWQSEQPIEHPALKSIKVITHAYECKAYDFTVMIDAQAHDRQVSPISLLDDDTRQMYFCGLGLHQHYNNIDWYNESRQQYEVVGLVVKEQE